MIAPTTAFYDLILISILANFRVTPGVKPPILANWQHSECLLARNYAEYAEILFLAGGFDFSWPKDFGQ